MYQWNCILYANKSLRTRKVESLPRNGNNRSVPKLFTKGKGFTLIELIVVFSLIGILTSLGIASYAGYNSSQIVQSNASNLVTQLNSAKSLSISQVIPTSCGTNYVTGYQVDVTPNGKQYTVSAMCGSKQVVSTYNLPTPLTFGSGSTSTVFFAISTGIVASTATITVTGYGKTKTVTVTPTGSVSIQ